MHRCPMLWVLHHMTYFNTHAAAKAVADRCALDDGAWAYEVKQTGQRFIISIFDEDGHYVGNL